MSKKSFEPERKGQKRVQGCCSEKCDLGGLPPHPSVTPTTQSGCSTTKRRRIETTFDEFLPQPSEMKESRSTTSIMTLAGRHSGRESNSDNSNRRLMRESLVKEGFLKQLCPVSEHDDLSEACRDESRHVEKLLNELFDFNESHDIKLLIDSCGDEVYCDESDDECVIQEIPGGSKNKIIKSKDIKVLIDSCRDEVYCDESDDEYVIQDIPGDSKNKINKSNIGLKILIDSFGDEVDSDESDDECAIQDRPSGSQNKKKNWKSKKNKIPNSSYGANYYNANEPYKRQGLRPIIIDGSNVAMTYSRGKYFSSKALEQCCEFFLDRNHEVFAIVPQFRLCKGQARDQHILNKLYHKGCLYFSPSRTVNGRLEVSYDDRYLVQLACCTGGVIVSRDLFRDLLEEEPSLKETINNRLLQFVWIGKILFFPKDPRGKHNPTTLDEYLRF